MKTSIIFLLLLVSCGREMIMVTKQGVDGYSLVSETGILYANSACVNGGNIISLYKDIDRNDRVTLGVDRLETVIIICNGKDGIQGAAGADGQRGLVGAAGATGAHGIAGTNGTNGAQGVAGTNGTNGATGASGTNSILEIIDIHHTVCGLPEVNFSEVLIKLADGRILSSFSDDSNGRNTRFAILVPGVTYSTTDGNSCRFKITTRGTVERL